MLEDRRKPGPNRRLDSWKEIASYFGRDERTLKRWEKDRGLPVRRLPGARGGVYAFTDELTLWMSDDHLRVTPPSQRINARDQPPVAETVGTTQSVGPEIGRAASVPGSFSKLVPRFSIAALVVLASALTFFLAQKRILPIRGKQKSADTQLTERRHVPIEAAQDLYLKGRYYWSKRTAASLTKALGYFQQAVAIDPSFALAYVGLADCYNLLREFAAMPEDEAYRKAIAAARKAIELDSTLPEAHNSLAFDLFFGALDRSGAEQEFQTALKLNPNCELAHHWYATYLMTVGRPQEALEQIETARRLNSSSTAILADKGLILYIAGHTEEAIALLKQIEKSEPTFVSSHRYLATIDLMARDYHGYLEESRHVARLSGNETERSIVDAAAKGYRNGGSARMFNAMLDEQRKWYNKGQFPAYRIAETYSLLGQKEQALAFLRLSLERHESALAGIMVDPQLNSLHDDPSYRQLAAKARLG